MKLLAFSATLSRRGRAQVLHEGFHGFALKAVRVPHHGHGANGLFPTEGAVNTLVAGVGRACHFGND